MWPFSTISISAMSTWPTPNSLFARIFSPRKEQRQHDQVTLALSSDNGKRCRITLENTPGSYPDEVDTIVADVPIRTTPFRGRQDAHTTPSRSRLPVIPTGNSQPPQRKTIWQAVALETGLRNVPPPKPYPPTLRNRFARTDANRSPSYLNLRTKYSGRIYEQTSGRKRADGTQRYQPESVWHQSHKPNDQFQTPTHAQVSTVRHSQLSHHVNGDSSTETGQGMKVSQQPGATIWDKLKDSYSYTSPTVDDLDVDKELALSEKMVRKRVGMARLKMRQQERAEKEKPPFVRKPPQELMDSIAQWMQEKDGTRVISTMGRDSLDRRDLSFIVPQQNDPTPWLNDNLIASFLNSICTKGNEMYKEKARELGIEFDDIVPRYYSFNPQWYPKMAGTQGYEGIKNWAKRAKVGGNNMMKCGKIFIPINDSNHWTLLVIFPQRRLIRFYNSLSGYGADSKYLQKAVEFLKNELKDAFKPDEWTAVVGTSGQQKNGSDCGVFTCFNALATFYTDEPSALVPDGVMEDARSFIAGALINGGFKDQLELKTLYEGFEAE
jgi:hypothetical protein